MRQLCAHEEMAYKPKNMRSILGVTQERLRGWRALWDPYLPDRRWPESKIEEIKLRTEYSGRDLLAFRVLMTLVDIKGVDTKKLNKTDTRELFAFCRHSSTKEIKNSKVAYNSVKKTLSVLFLDNPSDLFDLEAIEAPLKSIYMSHLAALDEDTSEKAEEGVIHIEEKLKLVEMSQ